MCIIGSKKNIVSIFKERLSDTSLQFLHFCSEFPFFPSVYHQLPAPRLRFIRKMEVPNLSEKLLYIFQITRHHIPQDRNFYRPLGRPHLTFSFCRKDDETIRASLRCLVQNSEILCWKVFGKRVDFFTFFFFT